MTNSVVRRAARLLVIDAGGCVLLVQYQDERGAWWATPGGGLEDGETFEQAAVREAMEELALPVVVAAPLWERTVEFTSMGRSIRQTERFFLVRCARDDIALGENVREAHHHEGIAATRWWSPDELGTTSERVFPEDLGDLLRLQHPQPSR